MYIGRRATAGFPAIPAAPALERRLLRGPAGGSSMLRSEDVQRDTPAWIFQVWASFAISVGMTALGVVYLPMDPWIRAFLGMGLLFSVGSALTLAKTLRDNHEARRLINRLSEAKAEKIIRDFEINDATGRAAA
jgi:hypothetical protein